MLQNATSHKCLHCLQCKKSLFSNKMIPKLELATLKSVTDPANTIQTLEIEHYIPNNWIDLYKYRLDLNSLPSTHWQGHQAALKTLLPGNRECMTLKERIRQGHSLWCFCKRLSYSRDKVAYVVSNQNNKDTFRKASFFLCCGHGFTFFCFKTR